jgi:hypothetical protein
MKAKTITIETVCNGWIVRPYPELNHHCCIAIPSEEIFCYTSVEALQQALPSLLREPIIEAAQ